MLGNFWDRNSDRFSRCVFNYFLIDFDVHFGSIFASKTAPASTPTRKGRPSILNNSPMKIQLFDSVVVAGGSTGRALKRNTFQDEILPPKCLQIDSKMAPQKLQNGIKKRSREHPTAKRSTLDFDQLSCENQAF